MNTVKLTLINEITKIATHYFGATRNYASLTVKARVVNR